jgi:hypothetical protein
MKRILFLAISLALLASCDEGMPEVTFDNPQPAEIENETFFGKRIQGTYVQQVYSSSFTDESLLPIAEDTTLLAVAPDLVTALHKTWYKGHRNDLFLADSSIRTDKQAIADYAQDQGFANVRWEGDTLRAFQEIKDTIFQLNGENVLRHFRGSYFMNQRLANGRWALTRARLQGKYLTFSKVYAYDSTGTLYQEITPVKLTKTQKDTTESIELSINPTKKELRKIIREDLFVTESVYKRIK